MPTPHALLGLAAALATLTSASASIYIPNIHARQEADDSSGDGDGDNFSDVALSLSSECQSAIDALVPLYSEAPTAPAALATATAIPADPCAATADFSSGTELSEWESYTSAAMGWYSAHSGAIDSALSSCSELTEYYGDASMPVCTDVPLVPTAAEGAGPTTAATTTDATATSDDGGSGGGSSSSRKASAAETAAESSSSATGESSSSPTNATTATEAAAPAPRETGVIVVAAAIVAAGASWGFLL